MFIMQRARRDVSRRIRLVTMSSNALCISVAKITIFHLNKSLVKNKVFFY